MGGVCSGPEPPREPDEEEDEPSVIPNSRFSTAETGSDKLSFHPSQFMSSAEFDLLFKVLLIGESGVGKSSILLRFADDHFRDQQGITIGVDFKIRTIVIDGKRIKLQIWDTAGQERFRAVARAYFRGTHGVIMVYDLTNRRSFEELNQWSDQLASYAPSNCLRLIVGNKLDRAEEREVPTDEAAAYAQERGVLLLETSAKDNTNIGQAFETIAREIKERINQASTSRFSSRQ